MTLNELAGYPCPSKDLDSRCDETCIVADVCTVLPIYRKHMALREDHRALRKAVLGDMTAAEAAKMYRRTASGEYWSWWEGADRHLYALADVVKKL